MKISSDLIKEYEQQESGGSSKDDYLNYSQLEHKQNIEFALLEADPFEYWMVWGDPVGEGKKSLSAFWRIQPAKILTPSLAQITRKAWLTSL